MTSEWTIKIISGRYFFNAEASDALIDHADRTICLYDDGDARRLEALWCEVFRRLQPVAEAGGPKGGRREL